MAAATTASHLQPFEVNVDVVPSGPEGGAEEEAGRGSGREGDRGGRLNSFVWTRLQTPARTKQQLRKPHLLDHLRKNRSETLLPVQDLLELTEKPLEEREEGAQNGLKEVETETEAEPDADGDCALEPPAGDPVPEPAMPPASMNVPLKDDPAQDSQSEPHVTPQDMQRAKRIRVRRSSSVCGGVGRSFVSASALHRCVSLPHCVLPSQMDVQVGETKNGGSTCALKAALGLSRQPFAFLQKQHVSSGNLSSPRQNAALQHLFIRKSFRPFKCPHCGKAFRDKDKLEQHLRVHGRDAYTFACHICSKSFLSDSSLEDHLLLHAENRSFSCLLCPETFERVELLKEHVEVHSVDGAFTCPSCKKTFSDFIQVSPGEDAVSRDLCHYNASHSFEIKIFKVAN